jgi:hypothetical protein
MAGGGLQAAITTGVEAWWRWLAVNAFFILFAIYLASTACLVALALQARSLSRRVGALARSSEQRGALIEELRKSIDALAIAHAERITDERQMAPSLQVSENQPPTTIEIAVIRDELRALIGEMASESQHETLDLRAK